MPLDINIDFSGFQLPDILGDVIPRVRRAVTRGLRASAHEIARVIEYRAQAIVPVRTGRLRSSLTVRASGSRIIVSGVFYWPFVDARVRVLERALENGRRDIERVLVIEIRRAINREFA